RDGERAVGRHDRCRRRVQLLSDEESRRARRRRRRRHQRSRTRRSHPPPPQRRTNRSLSSSDVRGKLAARRDAGRRPACEASASVRLDRAAPRDRRALSGRAAAGRGDGAGRVRSRPRLSSVRRPNGRACGAAGASGGARNRNADSLSGADPASARARSGVAGRVPAREPRVRRGALVAAVTVARRPRGRRGGGGRFGIQERIVCVRALITGGAGFIGSHLSEALLAGGHEVLILDNLSTGSIDNIAHLKGRPGFEYFIDSVNNEPLLAELIDRSDVVFHFAAAVGVKLIVEQPVHTIETNVHGTEVVLKHANKKKKLVVIASTSEVYGKS